MLKVNDLQTDFADGILLIQLLEVISSKQLPKHNKNPRIRHQKLENLTFALEFLKSEGIKLVNIDSANICDGNLKLILGLIWTIILRYQIQVSEGQSAKQELLDWVRSKIPEYNINNFTSDWQSGKAICALAEAVLPGQMKLPQDFSNDPVKNAHMGMQKAKENMNIPDLLDAEDMVHSPDELANMTYISYFRDYLDLEARRREQDLFNKTPVPAKCIAYGPGLEPGNEAGIPTRFTIEARNGNGIKVPIGGHKFPVTITGPSGKPIQSQTVDNGDGTYDVTYCPVEDGNHVVEIKHNDQHIAKSPINVYINPARPDPIKCLVYGPGLEGGEAHKPAVFTIEARNKAGTRIPVGGHPFAVKGTDPYGEPLPVEVVDNNDGTYTCSYTPTDPGDHHVEVTLNRAQVANSPYTVPIGENVDLACPSKSYAKGPGLEPGNKSTDDCEFTIYAVTPDGKPKKSGGDLFDVFIEDPNNQLLSPEITDNGDGTYNVKYSPTDPGTYNIDVVERNPAKPLFYDHLKNSPVTVQIDPGVDASQCIAYGPGLEPGNLDTKPSSFTIQARDKNGVPMKEGGTPFIIDIQGPEGPVKADMVDNGDGTYDVSYQPNGAGPHDISVTLDDIPIKGSTFHVDIKPGAFAGNTFIKGYTFVVQSVDKRGDSLVEGGQNVEVKIEGPAGKIPVKLTDNNDGTYTAHYELTKKGQYTIDVTVDGQSSRGSPFVQTVN